MFAQMQVFLSYIFIPFHYVVSSNDKLTGFAYGMNAKRWLLGLEKKQCLHPQSLQIKL